MAARDPPAPGGRQGARCRGASAVRIGIGYDVHALAAGRALVLGGVGGPYHRGLGGHSDAAALGTIGEHFPDTDPRFQGVSSLQLLTESTQMVERAGWKVVNVDTVVVAQ